MTQYRVCLNVNNLFDVRRLSVYLDILINVHHIFMTFSDLNTNGLRYLNTKLCCIVFILHDFIGAVTIFLDQPLRLALFYFFLFLFCLI